MPLLRLCTCKDIRSLYELHTKSPEICKGWRLCLRKYGDDANKTYPLITHYLTENDRVIAYILTSGWRRILFKCLLRSITILLMSILLRKITVRIRSLNSIQKYYFYNNVFLITSLLRKIHHTNEQ